jgi:hypothetical protein
MNFVPCSMPTAMCLANSLCQIPPEIRPWSHSGRSPQYSIANPLVSIPRSAGDCSTRRTSPSTSTGRGPISSGIPSRSILSATFAPTGGHLGANTYAPCSLTSRLRPSPCWRSPFPFVHRNVTAVCNRNRRVRLAGCPGFKNHPHQSFKTHGTHVHANQQENECPPNVTCNVRRRLPGAVRYKCT